MNNLRWVFCFGLHIVYTFEKGQEGQAYYVNLIVQIKISLNDVCKEGVITSIRYLLLPISGLN